MTSSDRFPVPVRSTVKSNFIIANLSKRDLNALTVQASTTELGKLFQIFTIFTGRMLFLTPNQQCQSTEGNSIIHIKYSAKLDASNNTTKCYCIEGQ